MDRNCSRTSGRPPQSMHYLKGHSGTAHSLSRALPGISKKMLTQTLRNLETWGLVSRKIYREVPPKVEYSLTALGKKFTEPMQMLCDWAEANARDVRKVAARRN